MLLLDNYFLMFYDYVRCLTLCCLLAQCAAWSHLFSKVGTAATTKRYQRQSRVRGPLQLVLARQVQREKLRSNRDMIKGQVLMTKRSVTYETVCRVTAAGLHSSHLSAWETGDPFANHLQILQLLYFIKEISITINHWVLLSTAAEWGFNFSVLGNTLLDTQSGTDTTCMTNNCSWVRICTRSNIEGAIHLLIKVKCWMYSHLVLML